MNKFVKLISIIIILLMYNMCLSAQVKASSPDVKKETVNKKSKKSIYLNIDTAIYLVTYNCKIVPDTANAEYKKDGFVVTLVGDKYAKFLDKAELDATDLRNNLISKGVPQDERVAKVSEVKRKGIFKEQILINYPHKDVNFFHCYLSGNYKQYEDSTAIQQWTIGDETKDYLGHKCRKATCHFRGRDYVAWYAEDIPISYGPYIFRGLPGLIVELHDTNNEYAFNMVGFEKPAEPLPIKLYVGKAAERLTREDFRFLKEYYNENGAASLFDGPIKLQVSPERKAELEKRLNRPQPYNPIELE